MRLAWIALALPLLGSEPRVVRGVVLTEAGAPLAGVCLDHYGAAYCGAQSDALGAFQIRTNAPLVLLRNPGYAPQVVKLAGKDDLRIVMLAESRAAPPCRQKCDSGIYGTFCFPPVKGVRATKPFTDVDYTARTYVARIDGKKGAIMHGHGPTWSLGLPRDRDVWESVEYSERDYVLGGKILIVDAKGRKSDGTLWRNMGMVGESAFYETGDPAIAALLDRVLDGSCFTSKQASNPATGSLHPPYSQARFATPLSRSFTRS